MKVHSVYRKILVFILILSIVTPVTFLSFPVQKTYAATGDFDDAANIIAAGSAAISAISDAISSAALSSLVLKEYVLDPLTVLLREIIIQSITASIVNWINNGFEGSPAFITDLEGFLLDVADQVVGAYIEGSELADLCSPFRLDVRIALALDYYSPFRDRAACTLTGVLQNISDAFGDFSTGQGWDAWFELSVNPYNNALGSYLGSRNALRTSIAQAQSRQLRILDWGNGYRSYEVCDTEGVQDPRNSANISIGRLNCRIATPGVVINEQLSDVLGTGYRQLELADELNEIIGALLGQLAKQVLGGSSNGLAGLSQSSFGAPSYTDQLLQENRDSSTVSGRALEAIRTSIQNEEKYRSAKQTSLNAVRVAREKAETLHQCYLGKAAQKRTLWGIVDEGGVKKVVSFTTEELAAKANSATTTINSLLPLQTRLNGEIGDVDTIIGQLIVARTDIENARSVDDLNNAVGKYTTLQQGGQLKTIKDIADAELERDGFPGDLPGLAKGIIRDMAALNAQTDADLKVCQSLILIQEPALSST
ncbi:hypothetical protein HYW58_01145 [Candidatus Kaiserbacteria bacterium]|nr:hypothetical protein [Candidatus Kaiserbacteria bacterium]